MATLKKKKELQEKISEANRFRRIAIAGLIVGVAFIFLGIVLFAALFIIGYTIFIICTGTVSFLTVLKWLYSKALKTEMEEKTKPPPTNLCSRCGTRVRKNTKYCPKCGKKIQTKKR